MNVDIIQSKNLKSTHELNVIFHTSSRSTKIYIQYIIIDTFCEFVSQVFFKVDFYFTKLSQEFFAFCQFIYFVLMLCNETLNSKVIIVKTLSDGCKIV